MLRYKKAREQEERSEERERCKNPIKGRRTDKKVAAKRERHVTFNMRSKCGRFQGDYGGV